MRPGGIPAISPFLDLAPGSRGWSGQGCAEGLEKPIHLPMKGFAETGLLLSEDLSGKTLKLLHGA
jgi:hypothetical protein